MKVPERNTHQSELTLDLARLSQIHELKMILSCDFHQ